MGHCVIFSGKQGAAPPSRIVPVRLCVEGRVFSNLSDNELDDYVRQILTVTPGAGLRMVQGALKQRSLEVQRDRVLQSLRRVDPVTTSL